MGQIAPHPPRPGRLLRPDLLRLLDRSRDFSLTLILAPAGSGKSTLLSQWASQDGRRQVRLSLNRRDADPLVFLQRLNESLRQALPGYAMLSCNALSTGPDQAEVLAASLTDSLAANPEDLWLLIDDFHFATAPLVQQIFSRLLEDPPPALHLVLSSRSYPGFSLSRLKLEDRLLMLDGHDLRLSADQLPGLCASLKVPPLDEGESLELMRLTEGWLAGIRLALMVRARTGQFMPRDFSGGQPELVDYFTNVVLAELPANDRDFLLATALFERFDPALCAALPGLDQPAARLEGLLHKGLFLHAIEDMPGWYRYHPLLQHVLKDRLRLESPGRLADLHQAAARHFLERGEEEAALFHARRAGHEETLTEVLHTACERWLKQGKLITILRETEGLPADRLQRDPGLFLPILAALIFSRQFDRARLALDAIRACHGCDSCPDRIPDSLKFIGWVLTLFQDDNELWHDSSTFRIGEPPCHDLRDTAWVMAARHYLLSGRCGDAIRHAGQARLLLDGIGHVYLASFADVVQILSERELGHILVARQMTQDFWNRHCGQPKTPSWVNAGACMVVSLYEQNRVAEARELAEALIQHVDSACATEIVFHVYVTLARLQFIAGHHARGSQLLLQLRRILRHGRYRRLLNELLAEELAQALRSGQSAAIRGIAIEYGLPEMLAAGEWDRPATDYREDWVYGGIAAALWLRSRKQFDKALSVLDSLEYTLERTEMKTRRLVVEANRIVILQLHGRGTDALQALAELFARVGLQCAIRTVFDEAPGFGELVRMAHEQAYIQLPEIYLQLYANVLYPPLDPVREATAGPEPLTTKELEVLELVRQGLPNKEIARTLDISLSTAKWHLKNIFAKLQVGNRTAAMAATSRGAQARRA